MAWIFLNNAMCSVVADRDNPDNLLVRARVKGDLERIFPDAKTSETPNADYRFRVSLHRDIVGVAIAEAVANVSYDNFKNSVDEDDRHTAYLSVWSAMHRLQVKRLPVPKRRFGPLFERLPERLPFASDTGWWNESKWSGAKRAPKGPNLFAEREADEHFAFGYEPNGEELLPPMPMGHYLDPPGDDEDLDEWMKRFDSRQRGKKGKK